MKIMKWIALLGIVMTAGMAFIREFTPALEKWREQYPPEPEEDDEEEQENAPQIQTAEQVFNTPSLTEEGGTYHGSEKI